MLGFDVRGLRFTVVLSSCHFHIFAEAKLVSTAVVEQTKNLENIIISNLEFLIRRTLQNKRKIANFR